MFLKHFYYESALPCFCSHLLTQPSPCHCGLWIETVFLLLSEHKHLFGLLSSFSPQTQRTLTFRQEMQALLLLAPCLHTTLPSSLLLPLHADADT